MFQEGRGVPHDDRRAVRWYLRAAKFGDATAQNNLGTMYQDGRGVEVDFEKAVRWYTAPPSRAISTRSIISVGCIKRAAASRRMTSRPCASIVALLV